MLRRIMTFILALSLLASCALAYSPEQFNTAEALNALDLFRGRSADVKDYALDANLTRDEGVTLLVRLLGKEKEALAGGDYGVPFTDVPKTEWSVSYVGYAAKHNITNGVSKTKFAPNSVLSDNMFLTLLLRAMGYSTEGSNAQFTWDKPYAFAKKIGLIDYTAADKNFTRGDAVTIFWNALDAKLNGTSETLAYRLVEQKVFTRAQLSDARDIAAGIVPEPEFPDEPSTPDIPSTPDTPSTPSTPPQKPNTSYTYEEYMALTPAQQQAFFESFSNPMDYITWYNAAKAAYDAAQKDNEITGDGNINIGDLMKP